MVNFPYVSVHIGSLSSSIIETDHPGLKQGDKRILEKRQLIN